MKIGIPAMVSLSRQKMVCLASLPDRPFFGVERPCHYRHGRSTFLIFFLLRQPPTANNATFKTVKSPCTIFLFSVECPQETAEAYKAGREVLQYPTPLCRRAR